MKIKTLVAVLLLSGGVTSTFAQSDCNANSSISHEAVRAKNFKDAYAPCMEVLKDCPTLRYYTYTDAQKILVGLMSQIKDRNSAEYKKLFDELMEDEGCTECCVCVRYKSRGLSAIFTGSGFESGLCMVEGIR